MLPILSGCNSFTNNEDHEPCQLVIKRDDSQLGSFRSLLLIEPVILLSEDVRHKVPQATPVVVKLSYPRQRKRCLAKGEHRKNRDWPRPLAGGSCLCYAFTHVRDIVLAPLHSTHIKIYIYFPQPASLRPLVRLWSISEVSPDGGGD